MPLETYINLLDIQISKNYILLNKVPWLIAFGSVILLMAAFLYFSRESKSKEST